MPNNQAGQILDVFSTAEIHAVNLALEKLKDAPNWGRKFQAYTNGFKPNDLIYPFIKKNILDKIKNILNQDLKLTHGIYLKEQLPWPIHTDYVKGDENPGLAVLIPLNTDVIATNTVIFNECCTDSFENYMRDHDKIKNNAVDLQSELMIHETIDRLEYVSVKGVYKWHPGSIIYWDRKLLHSSDNFLINNLTKKTAVVLFFHND